jgi:hypothetical protein
MFIYTVAWKNSEDYYLEYKDIEFIFFLEISLKYTVIRISFSSCTFFFLNIRSYKIYALSEIFLVGSSPPNIKKLNLNFTVTHKTNRFCSSTSTHWALQFAASLCFPYFKWYKTVDSKHFSHCVQYYSLSILSQIVSGWFKPSDDKFFCVCKH